MPDKLLESVNLTFKGDWKSNCTTSKDWIYTLELYISYKLNGNIAFSSSKDKKYGNDNNN